MTFLVGDGGSWLSFDSRFPAGADTTTELAAGVVTWNDIMASSVGGMLHLGFDAIYSSPVYEAVAGNAGASF